MICFYIWCDLPNVITALSTFILAAATVIIGIAAYLQYEKNSEIKRAEFLMSLYEKFYGNTELKEIREWIDQEEKESKVTEQDFIKKKNDDKKFEEKLTDYLNFFQFTVVLRNLGQIKEIEINQMFNYYIELLRDTPFIRGYVSSHGYGELESFLKSYMKSDK